MPRKLDILEEVGEEGPTTTQPSKPHTKTIIKNPTLPQQTTPTSTTSNPSVPSIPNPSDYDLAKFTDMSYTALMVGLQALSPLGFQKKAPRQKSDTPQENQSQILPNQKIKETNINLIP